jgi:MFS family permease
MSRLRLAARGTFQSLQVRNFRLFLIGQMISQIGTWVQIVAQSLLVLRLTDSGVALGIVIACQFVPTLLFGAWGGVLCDRLDKRKLMFGAVYVFAGLLGMAKVFDDPPRRTLSVDLVDEPLIPNAVGLNGAVIQLARVIGPGIAAALIATLGIGWCFVANAASFAPVLVTMLMMDASGFPTTRLPRAKGQIREAVRYVRGDETLRVSLLLLLTVATLAFNWHVVLPLLAKRTFHGDAGTYALLAMMLGIGSLIGTLLVARRKEVDVGFLAACALAFGITTIALAASPTLAVALAVTMVWGGWIFIFLTGAQTVLQMNSEPLMRGRVMALFGVVVIGVMPLGGLLSGALADAYGTRWAVAFSGISSIAGGAVTLRAVRRREQARAGKHLGAAGVSGFEPLIADG